MYNLILKKRDGGELTKEEIDFFIDGVTAGAIPDYQIAAFLMAVYLMGMNSRETTDLTLAMAGSGDMADLSSIPGVKLDKHSTGGVGDKTTLMATPIVAAAGIPIAKMTGKGMGHACGTVDKLDAIPGMRTSLDKDEFVRIVKDIGISIIGQTDNFVPADKYIYALRDVTATVSSIPLIASSVMSKKIASGADRIFLDVKTGGGAYIKEYTDSLELAKIMVDIGRLANRKTAAIISNMDVPLGTHVGNALETIEAISVLKNEAGKDLTDFALFVASRMMNLAGLGDMAACEGIAEEKLRSGEALSKLRRLITAQGGDSAVIDDYSLMPKANTVAEIKAERTGYIRHMDTLRVGMAGFTLGTGRESKDAPIDYSAGIILRKKPGDYAAKGDILAEFYTNKDDEALSAAREEFIGAVEIGDEPPPEQKLVYAYVDETGITEY